MPDKKRTRHGDRVVPHQGSKKTVEEEIREYYNAHRRSAYWWNGDRGYWPGFWMTMAQKFEMPIAQIKNIIGLNGITDRPLPAPLTDEQIRKRQEERGDWYAEQWREEYSRDFWQALRQRWIESQTDWFIMREWAGYKVWNHNSHPGWSIAESTNSIIVRHNLHSQYDADNLDEAKYYVESHA